MQLRDSFLLNFPNGIGIGGLIGDYGLSYPSNTQIFASVFGRRCGESFLNAVSHSSQSGSRVHMYISQLIPDTFEKQIPADHLLSGDGFMLLPWSTHRPAKHLQDSVQHGARPAGYPSGPAPSR